MITTPTHVFFYSGRQCFSNWHRTSNQINYKDYLFDSSEQLFMYLKANFFGDNEATHAAYLEKDPRKVKAIGRTIRGYDDAAWECVREGVMAYVNLLKYRQNATFAAELLSTGNRVLVEASPVDRIWGIGLDEETACNLDTANVWGRNLLGDALMTVRRLLRSTPS